MKSTVPRRSPATSLLFLNDHTLVSRRDNPQGAYTIIRNPSPTDLAAIVAAVDGARTLAEVAAQLPDLDADDIATVIEGLAGSVFELASDALPDLRAHTIAVIGESAFATELAAALAEVVGVVHLTEVPREALARFPIVIAAHSGAMADAIALNRALLAADAIALHVTTEADTVVVGPTTVPWKTACLECSQINWYFENHAADAASAAIAKLALPALPNSPEGAALRAEAVRAIHRELAAVLVGHGSPAWLGTFLRLSRDHGIQPHELIPTTNCESCFGCNRGGIHAFDPAAIPVLPALEGEPLVVDRTGGVRTIGPAEAQRRAIAAMAALGVAMEARGYTPKVTKRFPELRALPFFAMEPRFTFKPDAGLVIARPPAPCFGKGATTEQTMCSGMFEFVERTLHMYRGGVEIVRAPYAAVKDHAIDMVAFTAGTLAIPDRGSRVDFAPDIEIDWCWTRSLRDGRSRLVPAHSLFAGIVSANDRHPNFTFRGAHIEMPRRGSSGLSAGSTREDAILQGLYEVIEHDAKLVYYRTGSPAPAIDLDSITEPLTRQLVDQVRAAGFDLYLRDITRDIGVPVIEAYLASQRDLTFYRVPGWGAHHDPGLAIRRAITEAVQCIGAAESVASQTFMYGIYSITNSFHEDRYCLDKTEGVVRFDQLRRPDPTWTTSLDYLNGAIASVVQALPDAELCYFEYPSGGIEGVHVTAVFATHVVCNLRQGHIVQDRIREAGGRTRTLSELYLGELKI